MVPAVFSIASLRLCDSVSAARVHEVFGLMKEEDVALFRHAGYRTQRRNFEVGPVFQDKANCCSCHHHQKQHQRISRGKPVGAVPRRGAHGLQTAWRFEMCTRDTGQICPPFSTASACQSGERAAPLYARHLTCPLLRFPPIVSNGNSTLLLRQRFWGTTTVRLAVFGGTAGRELKSCTMLETVSAPFGSVPRSGGVLSPVVDPIALSTREARQSPGFRIHTCSRFLVNCFEIQR